MFDWTENVGDSLGHTKVLVYKILGQSEPQAPRGTLNLGQIWGPIDDFFSLS